MVFLDIWQTYYLATSLLPLKNPPGKPKTKKEELFFWFLVLNILMIIVNNLILLPGIMRDSKADAIVFAFDLFSIATLALNLLLVFRAQRRYEGILKWCGSLHYLAYDAPHIKKKLLKTLQKSEDMFRKGVFFLPIAIIAGSCIQMTVCSAWNGYFTPSTPFGVAWPGRELWFNVLIGMVNLHITVFVLLLSECLVFTIILVTFEHFFLVLEILDILVQRLNPSRSRNSMKITTKQIVQLHNSLIRAQEDLQSITLGPVMTFEVLCYSILTMVYVIFFHHIEKLFIAVISGTAIVPFMALIVKNEELMAKYAQLKSALYKTRWFEMTPMERKMLIPVMILLDRPKLLRAGPFHAISFGQLGVMIKRVYSYGLAAGQFISSQ